MAEKLLEKLLEIKDLSVVYQTEDELVRAVNGINLSLNKKETLGIVGETGAGKTTTALTIMKLLPKPVGKITGGQIIFSGRNILEMQDEELRAMRGESISMIFQDPMTALDPIMTVGDQIREALILHNKENWSKEEINARVDEVLEMVGIQASRKGEYPHQFSGGMKQRVVIAIALSCSPELLIADEPTTALDVTIQAQVLALMDDLKKRTQTSMIIITHDLGIVVRTCDYVAIMYAGEIVEYGSVEQIYSPGKHHPYTIGLFGSIPKIYGNEKRLAPIEGLIPDPTDLPVGCKFSPRCSRCMDLCREKEPRDMKEDGHVIKCFLYNGEGNNQEL